MYRRTTTFQAQSCSIDAGIAHVRDTVMPALERCRRVHRLVPVGRPVVRPMHRYQRLAVRGGDARERGVYSAGS